MRGWRESASAGAGHRAKNRRCACAAGDFAVPPGYFLKWTGQYELLEKMNERLRVVIPLTLIIIVVLLLWHFRNVTEVLIVLLSIPFALVGSVWLLWLLDYRLSTAVWVGLIALLGLDAETGVFMLLFLDLSYDEAKARGHLRTKGDLVEAIVHGAVKRVRPKAMTVFAAMIGLLPIMWSTGTGADLMKRIAAPMVGGLVTSTALTLLILPALYPWLRRRSEGGSATGEPGTHEAAAG